MQIERIYYPLTDVLGPGRRICIWTIGCNRCCYGCSNPELWMSNADKDITIIELLRILSLIDGHIDGLTITGGEPFMQPMELLPLVSFAKKAISEDVLVYTGFTLKELRSQRNPIIDRILDEITVLVDGKYIDLLNDNKSLRGSSNQVVHFLNEKFIKKYNEFEQSPRKHKSVFFKKNMILFGLPMANTVEKIRKGLKNHGIMAETE